MSTIDRFLKRGQEQDSVEIAKQLEAQYGVKLYVTTSEGPDVFITVFTPEDWNEQKQAMIDQVLENVDPYELMKAEWPED